MADSWSRGLLAGPIDEYERRRSAVKTVQGKAGMPVTHLSSGFSGTVVRFDSGGVVLRAARTGTERHFPLHKGGFMIGGSRATLVAPGGSPSAAKANARTASGSLAPTPTGAKVARPSRLLVEGAHDAELVEKVWGDDLRVDGIVVEMLDGIDNLGDVLDEFRPGPDARLGVLVDHLVPGSKESRLVTSLARPHVLVLGTPYVDVWQAVRPSVLGVAAWPVVPPGQPWKEGICRAFGVATPPQMWKRLLASVRTYADLEPSLVGAVEALIDFVTAAIPTAAIPMA